MSGSQNKTKRQDYGKARRRGWWWGRNEIRVCGDESNQNALCACTKLPRKNVNNKKWKSRIYAILIILAPHLSLLRDLEAKERQRRIRELWMFPFFVDEVVRERLQVSPVLQRKFKSHVICYLIRHRLKFAKEALKVLFYTHFLHIFSEVIFRFVGTQLKVLPWISVRGSDTPQLPATLPVYCVWWPPKAHEISSVGVIHYFIHRDTQDPESTMVSCGSHRC